MSRGKGGLSWWRGESRGKNKKMEKGEPKDKPLLDPIEIIHFTEGLSAKLHNEAQRAAKVVEKCHQA